MEKGWIKSYRSILEWEWYHDLPTRVLFQHLMLIVNWEEKKWQGKTIKPGEIITSVKHLASGSDLSQMQVRRALKNLESTGEIKVTTTNKYSHILIKNFEMYQFGNKQTTNYDTDKYYDSNKTTKSNNKQITNGQQTNNKQATTTKEYKEYKNKRNIYTPKKKRPKIESHVYDFEELERNLARVNKK